MIAHALFFGVYNFEVCLVTMKSILVVDDEEAIRIGLKEALEREGYEVFVARSAYSAEHILNIEKVDLMLLDIMMPNENGLDFCKRICSKRNIDVIIATASNDEVDQVLAYEFGARNYISKPFNLKILFAKIKNIMKYNNVYRYLFFDGTVFDTLEKSIINKQGVFYQLTNTEYEVLILLAENSHNFVNRDILFQKIYNYPYDGCSRNIDIIISKIRKKMNDKNKTIIVTSSQKGYSLNKTIKKFTSQIELNDFMIKLSTDSSKKLLNNTLKT